MRAFLRNRGAVAGLVILIVIMVMAALAPLVYPSSPWDMIGAPLPASRRAWLPARQRHAGARYRCRNHAWRTCLADDRRDRLRWSR